MTPYYDKNGIVIYCGDNVKTMREVVADDSIDLTVTSPPYDNLRDYNGFEWDFESLAAELWRVTAPGGVVVWVVGDATIYGSETGTSFRQALGFMEVGFRLHDTMIWDKTIQSIPTQDRYYAAFEYMFVLSKNAPKNLNFITDKPNKTKGLFRNDAPTPKERQTKRRASNRNYITLQSGRRTNVWGIIPEVHAKSHPAPFPEALARDHIISWSNPGDLVCDPFLGSGTTAKMAQELGRQCIGIELSEEYCKIAVERLGQPSLFYSIPDTPKIEAKQTGMFE